MQHTSDGLDAICRLNIYPSIKQFCFICYLLLQCQWHNVPKNLHAFQCALMLRLDKFCLHLVSPKTVYFDLYQSRLPKPEKLRHVINLLEVSMLGIWMNWFSIIIIFNVTGVHDQENTAVVTVSQQIESQAKRQQLVDQQGKISPSVFFAPYLNRRFSAMDKRVFLSHLDSYWGKQ